MRISLRFRMKSLDWQFDTHARKRAEAVAKWIVGRDLSATCRIVGQGAGRYYVYSPAFEASPTALRGIEAAAKLAGVERLDVTVEL